MTTRRTLTITMTPDWRTALRRVAKSAQADSYQGETLNFESPGAFFGRLTERRWALVTALQGQGAMAERELARRAGRDDAGGVLCRFADVHIDMHVRHDNVAA